jgi:hypothetical protein
VCCALCKFQVSSVYVFCEWDVFYLNLVGLFHFHVLLWFLWGCFISAFLFPYVCFYDLYVLVAFRCACSFVWPLFYLTRVCRFLCGCCICVNSRDSLGERFMIRRLSADHSFVSMLGMWWLIRPFTWFFVQA